MTQVRIYFMVREEVGTVSMHHVDVDQQTKWKDIRKMCFGIQYDRLRGNGKPIGEEAVVIDYPHLCYDTTSVVEFWDAVFIEPYMSTAMLTFEGKSLSDYSVKFVCGSFDPRCEGHNYGLQVSLKYAIAAATTTSDRMEKLKNCYFKLESRIDRVGGIVSKNKIDAHESSTRRVLWLVRWFPELDRWDLAATRLETSVIDMVSGSCAGGTMKKLVEIMPRDLIDHVVPNSVYCLGMGDLPGEIIDGMSDSLLPLIWHIWKTFPSCKDIPECVWSLVVGYLHPCVSADKQNNKGNYLVTCSGDKLRSSTTFCFAT